MGETAFDKAKSGEAVAISSFLADSPPGVYAKVKLGRSVSSGTSVTPTSFKLSDIRLHCPECGGVRNFEAANEVLVSTEGYRDQARSFICRDCRGTLKTFSLRVKLIERDGEEYQAVAYKFGELPEFGPPIPSKLLTLVGSERDHFFKGRAAERQGMGIAAFAYYRRVIDNRRIQIFDEIIKACKTLQAPDDLLAELEAAKTAPKFADAIKRIQKGLPPALYTHGHNPLTLLYSALSEGLHNETDDVCLELAASVRVVMAELVKRMSEVQAEDSELKGAVQSLLKFTGAGNKA